MKAKDKLFVVILLSLVLGLGSTAVVMAQDEQPDADAEEPEVVTDTPDVDAEDQPDFQSHHAEKLSERYNISEERVEELRSDGMGWGEVNIALALSDRIATESVDSENPQTLDDALSGVLTERADGKGWGEIANDHGFTLGEVVSESKGFKPEKVDRPGRADKPDRPDKPDKPMRPGKPDKPDKPEKPDNPGKPDLSNKPGIGLGR